jgi:hypothetical protein
MSQPLLGGIARRLVRSPQTKSASGRRPASHMFHGCAHNHQPPLAKKKELSNKLRTCARKTSSTSDKWSDRAEVLQEATNNHSSCTEASTTPTRSNMSTTSTSPHTTTQKLTAARKHRDRGCSHKQTSAVDYEAWPTPLSSARYARPRTFGGTSGGHWCRQTSHRARHNHPPWPQRIGSSSHATKGEQGGGTTLKIDKSQLSTTSREGTYCGDIKTIVRQNH